MAKFLVGIKVYLVLIHSVETKLVETSSPKRLFTIVLKLFKLG